MRDVRAMVSGSRTKSLWLHEDDVPWLVSYLAEEAAIGGVDPIDDPDGEAEDESVEDKYAEASQAPTLDGAAGAAPPDGDHMTPPHAKAKTGVATMRWVLNGA